LKKVDWIVHLSAANNKNAKLQLRKESKVCRKFGVDALNVSSIITESVRLMMWKSKASERIGVMALPVVPLGENKMFSSLY
jgi:hypothetical protein